MNIFLFECLPYSIACYPSVTELAILDVHDIDTFYLQSFTLCFFQICTCISVEVCSRICIHGKDEEICVSQ